MTSGSQLRRLAPSAPAIAVAVGLLTFGCTAPALTDRPVSESHTPEVVVTTATPDPTGPAHDYRAMQRQLRRELTEGAPDLKLVRSVLVSVDGRTTISYFNQRRPTDHAHVFSVTKSVISILVGIAIDEGRLRIDQTLQELLPHHTSSMTPQQASITLRQLLTMTAGISPDPVSLNLTADDTVSQILSYPMSNDPGAAFEYSDSSAHLVAAVLRNAVDRPILDYARARLFDPLGIDSRPAWQGWDTGSPASGFNKPGFAWAADRAGINIGAFGLKLTAPDLVKIGELYINGGRWHGRQIVSQAWVDESTSAQLSADQEGAAQGQYGYLWWVGEHRGHAGFQASGRLYQKITCFPDSDVVVVVTALDLSGVETLGMTLEPVLDKVIFNPLLH